jgi:methionyl-tRNA formyltransferase
MSRKILLCYYRDWAKEVSDILINNFSDDYEFYTARHNAELEALHSAIRFDLIFFIGWSSIVKKEILKSTCICMHPSALPKYRGGSPIQNQIINGEQESSVTFFRMTEKLDEGPIISQTPFLLTGALNDILDRIKNICTSSIPTILSRFFNGELHFVEQNHNEATYFKRLTPNQSEIKITGFEKFPASHFYNKIRMLQKPYPNAYIVCKNNTKLFITNSYGSDNISSR